jgi:CRISPR-associated endoribonuclease Cas6
VRLRFTTLTREVFNALSDSLLRHFAAGERLQIGRETFRLTRIVLDGVDDQLVGMSDYSRLFSLAPTRRFAFRFLTPTTFRVGDANLPLPVPQSVFRGLWQKWNAFAPPDLRMTHEVLTAAEKCVLPNAFRLRTGVHEMREGKIIGFLGDCSFELLGKVEEATTRAIAALSRFAFFAGVGAKTTMGLGQTITDWAR